MSVNRNVTTPEGRPPADTRTESHNMPTSIGQSRLTFEAFAWPPCFQMWAFTERMPSWHLPAPLLLGEHFQAVGVSLFAHRFLTLVRGVVELGVGHRSR